MKTLDYYMSLPYRLEIIPDTEEGGYTAKYPELPGCLTCAETVEELIKNAVDAKMAWLSGAIEEGLDIAEPLPDTDGIKEFSGQFKLRLPKSLHKSLFINAKKEGISMNQYCIYLLSRNDALAVR